MCSVSFAWMDVYDDAWFYDVSGWLFAAFPISREITLLDDG
jgi:hypothetical protein